jgi:hypothetical protein
MGNVWNMTGGGKPLPKLTTPGSAGDVLAGKQLIDQYGNPLTGTIQSLGEKTYSPSASEQRIAAGQYLSGAQIIKALPALSDPGSAGAMLKGKQLLDQDGNVVEGTIPSFEGGTYNYQTAITPLTIKSGQYLSGDVVVNRSVATITLANVGGIAFRYLAAWPTAGGSASTTAGELAAGKSVSIRAPGGLLILRGSESGDFAATSYTNLTYCSYVEALDSTVSVWLVSDILKDATLNIIFSK